MYVGYTTTKLYKKLTEHRANIPNGTEGNIIGNNTIAGIDLQNAQETFIFGNAIGNNGLSVTHPNGVGIRIANGSDNTIIGTGNTLGVNDYNLIGGNAGAGIEIDNSNSTEILGNSIGITFSGTCFLNNL